MSSAVVSGIAGAGGGIIAQIITYPLQTVNTRQQTERVAKKSPSKSQSNGSTLIQILQVVRTEGWGGLYSGLKPSLLGTAASQGIYYYFYQLLKNKAEAIALARKAKGRGDGTVGMFGWLVVAAIAGSLNVLFTIPIWVLVTRMQTQTQAERKIMDAKREALLQEASETDPVGFELQEKLAELEATRPRSYGTLRAASEVYHEAGIKGFWKGIIPTLIMVCNPSIQFMIYESSLKHLKARRAVKNKSPKSVTAWEVICPLGMDLNSDSDPDPQIKILNLSFVFKRQQVFLLGALAKLGATVTTYPLLVVKSRLQAKQEIGGNKALRYSGTVDAIGKMIRYEGLSSFYKGMSTKIVQSVFAASVLFMVKEEVVKASALLVDKYSKAIV
ncbi:peroxisomal nicotinamide adenine dinucleotide carrier-like isoform X1 [Impatiens glandulifera]|uniref:peroxisomal nicotinamide adenine dinucleotide carrier-like isoform X1 n=1 Tax=Impatiens glandulifera TaxID=253017 RepID=UPI001FB1175B|nr:peroxisomal nicotinamide adenine dinucleotide carrier-like isoform X1 [Impatiens glandulifera]